MADHPREGGADPRLLAGVEALLGRPDEDHPTGAQLVALITGELDAGRAGEVQAHVDGCHACAALLAAVGEAEQQRQQMERSLAGQAGAEGDFLPLAVPAPGVQVALAADNAGEGAPLPEDRRVLLELEQGRAVLYRERGRAMLGLFGALQLRVALDGQALSPGEEQEEVATYDLGPAGDLPGRELELRWDAGACRFALVQEEPGD